MYILRYQQGGGGGAGGADAVLLLPQHVGLHLCQHLQLLQEQN